ncbi:helix-turn-helix domain-containing protein [Lactobacillus equicursoris]|nr:helix-turn-helix transcriptional regulator [Lactobacillus equicursoris]
MNYLVANVQDVSLEKMAQHFGYQPKYLSRLIRQLFDQTFSQLKTETRVSISKSLLELTTKSIEEISTIVGYPSVSTYYRAFRQETGQTPNEYRRHHRQSPTIK